MTSRPEDCKTKKATNATNISKQDQNTTSEDYETRNLHKRRLHDQMTISSKDYKTRRIQENKTSK